MEVKCSFCNHLYKISKLHKDYEKLAKNPQAIYVCELCSKKMSAQAKKNIDFPNVN